MDNEDKDRTLEKETMEECSILYCTKDFPMSQTCMCWGWECGPGWFNVLRTASFKLESFNLLFYPKFKVRIQADQVKEKFGTLRFYFSVICDDEDRTNEQEVVINALEAWADEIVRWAEAECYKVCEDCGEVIGTKWSPRCQTDGWITYLCKRCAKKRGSYYFMDGAKWHKDKLIMSKAALESENAREKRMDGLEEEDDDEDQD